MTKKACLMILVVYSMQNAFAMKAFEKLFLWSIMGNTENVWGFYTKLTSIVFLTVFCFCSDVWCGIFFDYELRNDLGLLIVRFRAFSKYRCFLMFSKQHSVVFFVWDLNGYPQPGCSKKKTLSVYSHIRGDVSPFSGRKIPQSPMDEGMKSPPFARSTLKPKFFNF